MTTRSLATLATVLVLAASGVPAAAQPVGYWTDSVNLYSVDLASGTSWLIGNMVPPEDHVVLRMAFSPDGVLYAIDIATRELLTVDTSTGQAQVVATIDVEAPFGLPISGMAFDACGRLWAARHRLFEIDPETGHAEVRNLERSVTGLAARGETLFATEVETGALSIVDPDTGTVTLVGEPQEYYSDGLDFAPDGILWSIVQGCGITGCHYSRSFRYDLATGEATEVAESETLNWALAIGPPIGTCSSGAAPAIPAASPAGLALLAVSLAAAGAFTLARRRAA